MQLLTILSAYNFKLVFVSTSCSSMWLLHCLTFQNLRLQSWWWSQDVVFRQSLSKMPWKELRWRDNGAIRRHSICDMGKEMIRRRRWRKGVWMQLSSAFPPHKACQTWYLSGRTCCGAVMCGMQLSFTCHRTQTRTHTVAVMCQSVCACM